MKKFRQIIATSLCIVLVVLSSSFSANAEDVSTWDGNVANEFASGCGTTSDPFIIETAAQLAYFAKTVNSGFDYSSYHVSLNSDIVLNDYLSSNTWQSSSPANVWTPIGNSDHPFTGEFLGNNHKVWGLYSVSTDAGLFGYSSNAIIKDIILTQSYVSATNSAGGICAVISNKTTIDNCENYAVINGDDAGGIVGKAEGNYNSVNTIQNCDNHSEVSGNSTAGGIAGNVDYRQFYLRLTDPRKLLVDFLPIK